MQIRSRTSVFVVLMAPQVQARAGKIPVRASP